MAAEQAPIVIDLSQPDSPFAGSPLQKDALESLKRLVNERINDLDKSNKSIDDLSDLFYKRFHQTVLIQGGRGSGKTTFLLNALKLIREENNAHLCVLPMIDPTLIETKDHIIMVILQMIDEAVDRQVCDGHAQEELDLAREALAGGLALLDGIGPKDLYGNEWEDSSWVMSEGLRKAKKGRLFEQKFNEYIKCALKALKRKAFILAFDDVDTSFKRGHMILETIRKYLTSPNLFIVLSGDLDLYGRLVRKDIYATFGADVITNDGNIMPDGKNGLSNATSELEEQYLLKVLPPQYRIPMLPLGALTDKVVHVRLRDESNSEVLDAWASNQIRKQLLEKGNGQHPFLNVILKEHLRLVLGYLRALQDEGDLTASRRKVLQVFDSRLRAVGITELFLQRGMFDHTLRTIFGWFAQRDEPSALIMFRNPGTAKEAVPLHCLALALADGLKDGGAVLRALFTLALPAAMTKQTVLGAEKHKDVLEFLWRRGEPFLPDVAARITSISRRSDARGRLRASVFGSVGLAKSGSFSSKYPGVVRVYGIPVPDDTRALTFEDLKSQASISLKWLDVLTNHNHEDIKPRQNVSWFTIDSLLEDQRCGAFSPILDLISFRHFNSNGEIQYSISALSIFAVIGELLAADKVKAEDLSTLSLNDVVPYFGQSDLKIDDDSSEMDLDDDDEQGKTESKITIDSTEDESSYDAFVKALQSWRTFARDELKGAAALSPSLLGTLANRLNDALTELDDTKQGGLPTSTGQILHRQITNILNSVVTATADLTGPRQNPKSSDVVLGRALMKCKKGDELHPLAAILLSCPLVWVFLNPEGTFELSSTHQEKLRDTVRDTLNRWYGILPNKTAWTTTLADFEKWTTAPKVTVKISSNNQRSVVIDGFFDLLNVVPRYAEAAQSKK